MRQTITTICNFVIEYTFYAIILTVPFAFTDKTFELFEFNKMWLLFGYTVIIGTAWVCKMIAQKQIFIQKTPLDIPIGLFLLAHILSTLFSMDQHLSIWGYYSRFNGGLLSMFSYFLLYYAFASNISFSAKTYEQPTHAKHAPPISKSVDAITFTKRILVMSVVAGFLVALWGLPSHFGYDPTCLMFRGTFDVSCWTADFQPKVRIFSTMGQPNWLAAYLALLLPVSLAFGLTKLDTFGKTITSKTKEFLLMLFYFITALLFYIDIIYTDSQSGYIGTVIGLGLFSLGYIYLAKKGAKMHHAIKTVIVIAAISLLTAFFVGVPVLQLKKFTFATLQTQMSQNTNTPAPAPVVKQAGTALEGGNGGTESGTIRKYVWQGANDAWMANPLFGTGVETFAFAYYKYRPAGHNLTSEWDFLYNKAHNEYLNYLATTGAFGFLSYMSIIGVFLFLTMRLLLKHTTLSHMNSLLIIGLVGGYSSTLISNFFGFSVVLGNFYLFIIPIFVFILADKLHIYTSILGKKLVVNETHEKHEHNVVNGSQWLGIIGVVIVGSYMLITLISYWIADTSFALASNLGRIGQYEQGYKEIRNAISLRGDEPTFREELANSNAAIAVALVAQKQNDAGTQIANEAMQTINQLTADYPNNVNFLKSQVRVYYTLAQLNPAYMSQALEAMKRAHTLAPTDAKIAYNLGVLYGQTGQTQKGIEMLEKTTKLRPNYQDAYYALALFYRESAVASNSAGTGKSEKVTNPEMAQKAVEQLQFILEKLDPKNKQALDTLKTWGEN